MSFSFHDTATTEIYTLSLHDALPICSHVLSGLVILVITLIRTSMNKTPAQGVEMAGLYWHFVDLVWVFILDRKSTRLNSSHGYISYAVFCLKKKKHT